MQSLWGGDGPGRALATGGEGLSIAAALSSLQLPNLALPKPHSPIIGEQYLGKKSGLWKEMLWVASQACQIPSLASLGAQAEPKTDAKELSQAPQGKGENRGSHARWAAHAALPDPLLPLGMCIQRDVHGEQSALPKCEAEPLNLIAPQWGVAREWWGPQPCTWELGRDGDFMQKAQAEWCLLWGRPLEGDGRAGLCFPDQARTPATSRVLASSSPHPWVGQGYRKPCLTLLISTCHNTITLFFMPTWSARLHSFPFPVVLSHEMRTVTFENTPLRISGIHKSSTHLSGA